MRERIILAPGANGGELIKSLAMHGENCFNLRIVSAGELARIAMMRSGISIAEDFVSIREETAIMAEAVQGESYFTNPTYSDIQSIASAVRRMRTLIPDGDEAGQIEEILAKGVFEEKNSALVSIYKKYMGMLSDRNLVDSVSLMRKAMAECGTMDADYMILREYPLNPLQRALLEKLSGGKIQESSLAELYRTDDSRIKIADYKNCYGAPNEVETILTDIYRGKNPDRCTVAVTDPRTYGQLFFDYALLYDMPMTFGCGVPIINSYPARLLVLYYHWMTDGFFGPSSICAMLNSEAFDRSKLYDLYPETDENFSWKTYLDVLGDIRYTNDRSINEKRLDDFKKAISEEEALTDTKDEKAYRNILRKKLCIPYLEVLAKELSLPAEDFITKYAYIRRGSDSNARMLLMKLDLAAAAAIYEELKVIHTSGIRQATEDMIRNVLKMVVASGRSEEGKLHVTGIDGALSTVRENLYIAGLSASNYPGSPRENYLLLDSDLELFGDGAEEMTSKGRIKRKQKRLETLAGLASGLGSEIHISYAGLNVPELKQDNASSMIYALFRKEKGGDITSKEMEDHIVEVEYFEPAISATRKVGKAYNDGKAVALHLPGDVGIKSRVMLSLEGEYSPSALGTFFSCPRSFMLRNVLGIPEPDEDKPFEVMSAAESGTLAHTLMEKLADSDMGAEEFLKLSGEYFDRFIKEHPPLVTGHVEAEREQFLEMMEIAYRMDPHREVVLKEEDIHCMHESGIRIHGFPDRVEKLKDGSCLIVDFKSGRTIAHEEDDIDSCLQIVIYAYLMEQKGFKVSGGEFRYIRLGETVSCKYDKEMKEKLYERLSFFREHLEAADFPIPDNAYASNRAKGDPDPCKYCKFGMVCGKVADDGGSDDE